MSRFRWILLLLFVLAAINLAPLLYMLVLSLRGPIAESGANRWLGPWAALAGQAPIFLRWFANSTLIACVTVLFHLVADAMAGFVLAKRRFRGRGLVFALVLLAMMVPRQVTLIPLFLGLARAGLADTMAGLILPGLGDVIGVFLMRQFFITMPDAVLEAARVDGASEWQLFARVAMPLARPALAVLAVFAFQHYWTDFFWPLVIVQSPRLLTLQVGLVSLARSEFGPNLPLMAAGAVAASVPMLAVFLFLRRHLFEGLRAGALQ